MTPKPNPEAADTTLKDELLPLVPLHDNVVFPGQLAPLTARRPHSVTALEHAANANNRVVLAVQKVADIDDVTIKDLHTMTVVANVGALRHIPNSNAQALVEGVFHVGILELDSTGGAWLARLTTLEDIQTDITEVD